MKKIWRKTEILDNPNKNLKNEEAIPTSKLWAKTTESKNVRRGNKKNTLSTADHTLMVHRFTSCRVYI